MENTIYFFLLVIFCCFSSNCMIPRHWTVPWKTVTRVTGRNSVELPTHPDSLLNPVLFLLVWNEQGISSDSQLPGFPSPPLVYETSTSPPFNSTPVWTWRCLLVVTHRAAIRGEGGVRGREALKLFCRFFLASGLKIETMKTSCKSFKFFLQIKAHFPDNNISIKLYWIV